MHKYEEEMKKTKNQVYLNHVYPFLKGTVYTNNKIRLNKKQQETYSDILMKLMYSDRKKLHCDFYCLSFKTKEYGQIATVIHAKCFELINKDKKYPCLFILKNGEKHNGYITVDYHDFDKLFYYEINPEVIK